MRDRFANWLCSQVRVFAWAERRGSAFAVRLHRLCIARQAGGLNVRWMHLAGKADITDAASDREALSEDRRHD